MRPGSSGYWVAAWGRGRGVCTRALELITQWAFTEFAIERIELGTVIGNWASERVAEKAGYHFLSEVPNWVHGPTGKTLHIKRSERRHP